MNYLQLQAEIQANPACAAYMNDGSDPARKATAKADDEAIAAILSAGRTRVASRMVNERTVLGEYPGGPVPADALLSKLEAFAIDMQPLSSVVRRAMKFMATPEGIDVGSPATRAMLDELVGAAVITQDECDALKSLAETADVITAADVSRAMRGPWE